MPTIRVEYEVPDDDCWECEDSSPSFTKAAEESGVVPT